MKPSNQTPDAGWSILYRGSLSSCNYTCTYCPFAKTKNTREELRIDGQQLDRFVDWVQVQDRSIGILFTPWGEALIRKSYQRALARLSHMAHVRRVAIQTNVSCKLDWIASCDLSKLALWTTYHPTQISKEDYLEKCQALSQAGVRYSVGVVGFKEAIEDITWLRQKLPPSVYLWVNAYKREAHYYEEQEVRALEAIDPLFRYNTRYHVAQGEACRGGHTMFTVDEHGDMRRCHFIKDTIGNIYEDDVSARLQRRPCSNERCGCHIGYVHMDALNLYETFGQGVLERIPDGELWRTLQAKHRAIDQAREMLGTHHSTMSEAPTLDPSG